MTSRSATATLAVLLAACGADGGPELVVGDASMGLGTPSLLGAEAGAVYWTVAAGAGPRTVAGAALAALPTDGAALGETPGAIVQVGDHVLLATAEMIIRVGVAGPSARLAQVAAEALGDSPELAPVAAWTEGPIVSWGNEDVVGSATLNKVVRCDHLRVNETSIYVAADGTSGERRLMRIDRKTGVPSPLTASGTHAASFPGGETAGATYRGRLVGAGDDGALWLVEETAAGATAPARAILLAVPDQGTPTVLLEHVRATSGFFTQPDAFYWQEGDALLTAPRAGGAASIVGHLDAKPGAIDDGFVYYVTGNAIERRALDALD